jgi:hypothetical protein
VKGTIVKCMQDMIVDRYGADKWKESLRNAGTQENRLFTAMEDVTDKEVHAIMAGIGKTLSLSMTQVMDAFGEFWSTIYAPKVYSIYFDKAKSTREMLLNLDHIHVTVTKTIASAHPPRFRYEWQGDNHLVMHYESNRGLVALMPGLIRGLGKYYKDNPTVTVTGNAVHVLFAA